MDFKKLENLLKDASANEKDNFIAYCYEMAKATDKRGELKNYWFTQLPEERLVYYFNKVKGEGLTLDGKHVTIGWNGLSYDYIAYKNKMLLVYPKTLIDVQLVYSGDVFSFRKENGKVLYKHEVQSPFGQTDDNIIGGYCVIKNVRGEFLTTLSKEDLAKHRKVAKTDYIWKAWFKEMCLKTVIKKAVKVHFDDIYNSINEEDNKSIDLSNLNPRTNNQPTNTTSGEAKSQKEGLTEELLAKISATTSVTDCLAIFNGVSSDLQANKDFIKALTTQRKLLQKKDK